MKWNNFYSIGRRCGSIFITTIIGVCFFNCSDIYLSSWNCIEEGDHKCEQYGDIDLLNNKPSDVLIVLDNSPKGQEFNPQITSNLNQFLKCVKSADWRAGVISGVDGDTSTNTLGELINLEINGETSVKKFITPNIKNYETIFSDTVSLKSGCSAPPYCHEGKPKPLSAIRGFMEKHSAIKSRGDSFLRGYASLAIVIISTSKDEEGTFSDSGTDAQTALASVYGKYDKDEFISLVVTDSGNKNDCITTTGDVVSRGVEGVSKVGSIYGLGGLYGFWSVEPTLAIGSQLLHAFTQKRIDEASESNELINFARHSGGYIFDICEPVFGTALAYSVLENIGMEKQLPEECRNFHSDTAK
ncbi:MAG: hypothetical protein OXM55_06345 [Bdellovibrionales bacterium]|nr:hypothetical protein [Bdellovibrionales bacterium]